MMVLRHIGPPSATVVHGPPEDRSEEDERTAIPMDLSKSSVRKEPSRHFRLNNNSHHNDNNNSISNGKSILFGGIVGGTCPPNLLKSAPVDFSPPLSRLHGMQQPGRWTREDGNNSSPDSGLQRDSGEEVEESVATTTTTTTNGSGGVSFKRKSLIPLSLIRDRYNFPSEEDIQRLGLRSTSRLDNDDDEEDEDEDRRRTADILRRMQEDEEDDETSGGGNARGGRNAYQMSPPLQIKREAKAQNKRARLEEMVSAIKKTGGETHHHHRKPERSRRNSGGDDDTSSGGQATSGDEIDNNTTMNGSADLRRMMQNSPLLAKGLKGFLMPGAYSPPIIPPPGFGSNNKKLSPQVLSASNYNNNNNKGKDLRDDNSSSPHKIKSPFPDLPFPPGMDPSAAAAALGGLLPKGLQGLQGMSPADASKMYGVDPETYQQQMMQLQLASATMLGDPGGLLKAMGSYPPWVYLGYYSQLIHSFQAQEILRQYAMQSQSPTVGPGETSPPPQRTSAFNSCGSPASPASMSEGPTGMDSDGSAVGQTSFGGGSNGSGNGSNPGKRAPRAMTGRHVRTGTGASPTTLQTLRLKIEERQRLKAQQLRHDMMIQSHPSHSSSKSKGKFGKKFKK